MFNRILKSWLLSTRVPTPRDFPNIVNEWIKLEEEFLAHGAAVSRAHTAIARMYECSRSTVRRYLTADALEADRLRNRSLRERRLRSASSPDLETQRDLNRIRQRVRYNLESIVTKEMGRTPSALGADEFRSYIREAYGLSLRRSTAERYLRELRRRATR